MPDDAADSPGPSEPSEPPGAPKGAPGPVTFAGCGVGDALVRALRGMGATEPTPIQAAALPDALGGRDILGRAPTGSGKTLAFGIPVVQALAGAPSVPGRPRALVISPTRELAAQIADVLAELGTAAGLRTVAFIGGENISRQRTALAAPVDIAVVTPGRAHDLRRQGLLDLGDVRVIVVDEADELSDLGFLPDVLGLVRAVPEPAQRMLFSATLDDSVLQLMEGRDPVRHEVAEAVVSVDTMSHVVVRVPDERAADFVLSAIASRNGRTVIFANTKDRVTALAAQLAHRGVDAGFLHGDRGQTARRQALADFASGKVPVLVATDVAARGIDVSDLDLVVHADAPPEAATYVHRSGRTARGGATGTVATIVTPDRMAAVTAMLRKAGVRATVIDGILPARNTPGRPPSGPRFTDALAEWTGARRPSPRRGGGDDDAGRGGRGAGRGARDGRGGGTRDRRHAGARKASRPHRPKRKRKGKK